MISSSFYPRVDGTTNTISDLCQELVRDGNRVTLLTRWYPKSLRQELFRGIKVVRVGTGRRKKNEIYLSLMLTVAAIRLARYKDLVVHAHGTIPSLVAAIVRIVKRTEFIITFHQDLWTNRGNSSISFGVALMTAIQIYATHRARFVVAQSKYVRNTIMRFLRVKNDYKFRIVPNCVELGRYVQTKKRSEAGTNLIVVGSLSKVKGVDVLLRAMKEVVVTYPECRLVVAGDGRQRAILEALTRRLGLQSSVNFKGMVSREELVQLFAESDIAVSSSYQEFFPVSLIEAQAMGLPIVATKTLGSLATVTDGENGLLVNPGNSNELARGIILLLDHPKGARAMGMRGQEKARALYSLSRIAKLYSNLYLEALGILPTSEVKE